MADADVLRLQEEIVRYRTLLDAANVDKDKLAVVIDEKESETMAARGEARSLRTRVEAVEVSAGVLSTCRAPVSPPFFLPRMLPRSSAACQHASTYAADAINSPHPPQTPARSVRDPEKGRGKPCSSPRCDRSPYPYKKVFR
jgi:hypothetical protein